MFAKKVYTKFVIGFAIISAAVFLNTADALAKSQHNKGPRQRSRYQSRHHYHHPYYGKRITLPRLIASFIFHAGDEYYYSHGYFYQKAPGGYIIVDAPIGARVTSLPLCYKKIIVKGKTFYCYNNTYFHRIGARYVVVSDPIYHISDLAREVSVIEVPFLGTNITTIKGSNNSYTIHIPNINGSYTSVMLVKKGSSFIGPQGEHYENFPSVAQLQVVYGN
ncbi:MAG: DUF6515 family protein [Candidatus Aceula meridiana]|nr:DUF6515 family protein [Candidatus Aceula meridiana]